MLPPVDIWRPGSTGVERKQVRRLILQILQTLDEMSTPPYNPNVVVVVVLLLLLL